MQLTVLKNTPSKNGVDTTITFSAGEKKTMTPFGVSQTVRELVFFKGDAPLEVGVVFDINDNDVIISQLVTETGTTNWIVFK